MTIFIEQYDILLVRILDMTMWSNSREERLEGKLKKSMHGASSIAICSRIVGGH